MSNLLTPKELAKHIAQLKSLEIVELCDELISLGFPEPALAVAPAAAPTAAPAAEEKSSFKVVLTAVGDQKMEVLKKIRELTGLGLKEAKEKVDVVPSTLSESAPKEDAEKMKAALTALGAKVELQ